MSHCSTGLATLSSPIRPDQSRKHNQTTQRMANLVSYATLGGLFVEHVVMLSKILKSWGEHSTMMLLLLADQWSCFQLCPESLSNKHSAQHSNVMNSTNICVEHWTYFSWHSSGKIWKIVQSITVHPHLEGELYFLESEGGSLKSWYFANVWVFTNHCTGYLLKWIVCFSVKILQQEAEADWQTGSRKRITLWGFPALGIAKTL